MIANDKGMVVLIGQFSTPFHDLFIYLFLEFYIFNDFFFFFLIFFCLNNFCT